MLLQGRGSVAFTEQECDLLFNHTCKLPCTTPSVCVAALTTGDIAFLRKSFAELDRDGRQQLLAGILVQCPALKSQRLQYVLFGVAVCRKIFLILCDTSKDSIACARKLDSPLAKNGAHYRAASAAAAAAASSAQQLLLLNSRQYIEFLVQCATQARAYRVYDRATVESNRHRDQSSSLATVVTLGPATGRREVARPVSLATAEAHAFLEDLLLSSAQDWGKRKHKQRGLGGMAAGTPLLQLPRSFETSAFYSLYCAETAQPHLCCTEFLRHARDLRRKFNIKKQPNLGDMPLCNICGLASTQMTSARASGDEQLIAATSHGLTSHLWLVRQQRKLMQQLAQLSHAASEQLLIEAEPLGPSGGRVRASVRLQFRTQADTQPLTENENENEEEEMLEVWLTDRPAVLACANFAAGAPKTLSRAAVVRYSCQGLLRHSSTMEVDGSLTRNGTVSLLYVPNNVFKLGANFTIDGLVDALLSLPPLRVAGRKRTIILVLDNTVRFGCVPRCNVDVHLSPYHFRFFFCLFLYFTFRYKYLLFFFTQ